MAKISYYFLLLVNLFGIVIIGRVTFNDLVVSRRGEIIKAKIVKVGCGTRNSDLDLEFENMQYFVMISSGDCKNGKYQVGDSITVKALPEFSRAQLLDSNEHIVFVILIVFLLLSIIYFLTHREITMKYLSGKGLSENS